jgi:hypothetical protein
MGKSDIRSKSKRQYATSENDKVNWKDEGKMATKFYKAKCAPRDKDMSGSRMYGDAELDILKK